MARKMLDQDAAYKVAGVEGVAWHVVEHPVVIMEWDEWDEEGTEVYDWDSAVLIMVGDDQRFVYDVSDLTVLHDDDFCCGCGQIGCGW